MGRTLRVLHLDTARTWRGGERQVLLLAKGQVERGHAVLVAAQPESPLAHEARRASIPVAELAVRGEWDLVASARACRLTRRFAADLVHLHTAHAHAIGWLAGLWGSMPPKVVSRRVDFRPRSNALSRLKYRWPGQVYVAVSESVRQVLIESGVDPSRVRTIHSGIPLPGRRPEPTGRVRRELGIGQDRRIVVSVAALAPHKDHGTLLKAARRVVERVPEAHFVLVGDGPLADRIRRQVASLGLGDRVTLAGFRTDVEDILAESSVFVTSSRLEGLGTSTLDAMAAGLPVVATRVGGIPEMVRHESEGLLVPPQHPDALAEALVAVLGSEDRARRYGEAGRSRAAHFDISRTVDETEALYRDVLRMVRRSAGEEIVEVE